ncbi:MAG: type IV toxin-antitoxin system AbiEi family antitoxin domain-containing protein [Niveispirillum sp.]|uniref:type IV toxin-antitoxin system AbiEi family antitoxin domain-containing protein n=1 Tax=Niveispirillum sp. TaxID=1917217 RepID=UPI00403597A2
MLERTLPDGLLVDAAWMEQHGYSTSLRSQYVAAGWLVQPVRGTYKRPLGKLTWERAVISLQALMKHPLIVGGRTALELQGLGHYVSASGPASIHLHGDEPPPGWLAKLPFKERFIFHKAQTLFSATTTAEGPLSLAGGDDGDDHERTGDHVRPLTMSAHWPLLVSTPERAFLELLDELPKRETFHNVDMIAEGLRSLSPARLQRLLEDCRSVKVKRLFFWFAERHGHRWLNRIDRDRVSLGSGKRMLVKGGRLDPKYLITVPEDLGAPV